MYTVQDSYVRTAQQHHSQLPEGLTRSYPEQLFLKNAYPEHTPPQSKRVCATNALQGRAVREKERTLQICADLGPIVPPMTAH